MKIAIDKRDVDVKKLIKMVKSYYVSKEMWKAKMADPILPRRPSAEELKRIKKQGLY